MMTEQEPNYDQRIRDIIDNAVRRVNGIRRRHGKMPQEASEISYDDMQEALIYLAKKIIVKEIEIKTLISMETMNK
jgi:hypothetical protein